MPDTTVGSGFHPRRHLRGYSGGSRPGRRRISAHWACRPYVYGLLLVHNGPEDGYEGEHLTGKFDTECPCGARHVPMSERDL